MEGAYSSPPDTLDKFRENGSQKCRKKYLKPNAILQNTLGWDF